MLIQSYHDEDFTSITRLENERTNWTGYPKNQTNEVVKYLNV